MAEANSKSWDRLRRRAGFVGAATAFLAFFITIFGFIFLEASLRTWTVGRFFQNRAEIFADLFFVSAAFSVVTLILSFFGSDGERRVGVTLSIATLALVISIFWFET
jgi:hypothetical protein